MTAAEHVDLLYRGGTNIQYLDKLQVVNNPASGTRMSNFVAQLRNEISRLAKKESRAEAAFLKKATSQSKGEIGALTLARMRAEYVVPLTGKIQSRIEMLQKDVEAASSTAARNKLAKEVEKLKKKHVELLAYDEQLRHYADMRITLDLDDGVKVNYGKFGDLLDSVKVVTGGAGDD